MSSYVQSARPRRRVLLPLAVALGVALLFACSATRALAAPGTPGTPQAPTTVFDEGFEHGTATTPVPLANYTGASGETYTADAPWLTACNGEIVNLSTPYTDVGDCNSNTSTANDQADSAHLRQLAYALGVQNGTADPDTNHVVGAYTENGPGANEVEFRTVNPISLPENGRFLDFSVNAAAFNCAVSAPIYQFSLTNGSSATPVGGQINACGSGKVVNAPTVGPVAAEGVNVGTYTSNGSVLFSGSSLGISMTNANGSGAGNDAAFDDIKVLDVTPQLDKSFSPSTITAGGTSTLTFTITNTSELAAKDGWSFTDNLPAGVKIASPADASTTCPSGNVTASAGSGTVAVTGNLNAGETSCTVSVNVTAAAIGTYTNGPGNVTTGGLTPPGDTTLTTQGADLSIVKSTTAKTVVAGTNETYKLVVHNNGPATAANPTVSDPLPAGLTFVSASKDCANANGTVTCTAASPLNSGGTLTYTITAKVASSVDHALTNTATVHSTTPDPVTPNNTSTTTVHTSGEADLSIVKTASVPSAPVGGQVIYTLVVHNAGPSDATGVKVSDTPGTGITIVSAKPSQGSCTKAGSCSLGTIVDGGSAQIQVVAKVGAKARGNVVNKATVTANPHDPTPGNNTGTSTVHVPSPKQPVSDLRVVKHVNHAKAYPGQTLTYTLTVTNHGPNAAKNSKVTDTASLGLKVLSAKAGRGSCKVSGRSITCSLGTLANHKSVKITVRARVNRTGVEKNTASATSASHDPKPANNVDSASTLLRPVLRLAKTASAKTVKAGHSITYRLKVTNPTSIAIKHVKVCDALPLGLTFTSANPHARLSGGRECWTIRSLAAHASRAITVHARALQGTSGRKVNHATATGQGVKAAARAKATVRVDPAPKPKPTPVTG